MATASFVSLSRDNLIRLFGTSNFFEQNPGLASFAPSMQNCLQMYGASKKNSSCGCGGNTRALTPCFEEVLTHLENAKETNPEIVTDFIKTVTGQSGGGHNFNVAIYYTKNGGTTSHRYTFTT